MTKRNPYPRVTLALEILQRNSGVGLDFAVLARWIAALARWIDLLPKIEEELGRLTTTADEEGWSEMETFICGNPDSISQLCQKHELYAAHEFLTAIYDGDQS
jgi:hypothetical protein